MNTIGQFATDNAQLLGSQLSKLEQNVVKETASIRQRFALASVAIDDDSKSPIKTFTVGDCARLDTSLASPVVNLAPPMDGLPGEVTIVQAAGALGFIVVAINCKVNNAAVIALGAAPFAFVFRAYFDGKNFWI